MKYKKYICILNLIIYGHHIKGGKMFGALEDYKAKSFYEKHKTIDKVVVAGERMKSVYTKTKDKAEQSYYADDNSNIEYAADKASYAVDRIKDEGIHQFNKQGQKGVKKIKQSVRSKGKTIKSSAKGTVKFAKKGVKTAQVVGLQCSYTEIFPLFRWCKLVSAQWRMARQRL